MEVSVMVYAYTQDVPIGVELYQRIIDELGPEPMSGQLLHLCVRRPDGGLRYIDVWDSVQSCERAFDDRIHPAVDRAFGGQRPSGEPVVEHLEVLDARGLLLPDVSVGG
jgi:hypothetical protein